MKTGTFVLGMLLAVSLLANVVFLVRLRDREDDARPNGNGSSRTVRPETAPTSPRGSQPQPLEAAGYVPSDPQAAATPLPVPKSGSGKQGPSPVSIAAVRNDPQVLGVLEAQEEFRVFWNDLDRVFKAKSKFDESKYVQTVLASVQDFLGLPEPSRPAFSEAVKSATANLATARKDYDAARKTLPPKDKNNPVYQQQKDALDLRYDEQSRMAVDSVKIHLDLKQPRHAELASNLEKLLRNLTPKPPQ